eukprot:CAMPEP_0115844684 /NCGR_PEP_ID=MMETSP0287-20121206/8954_1 /TAXON_ID=412157 /ORGANISM="Chrysochromulina rotalis, Strain UIO044" /LENGTH=87 /DNA_ID=CAMNT_0003298415 /DNA_START=115 /DNA_END=378 /DNA_ORIENTATION=+
MLCYAYGAASVAAVALRLSEPALPVHASPGSRDDSVVASSIRLLPTPRAISRVMPYGDVAPLDAWSRARPRSLLRIEQAASTCPHGT